jgi:nitrogen-specific signal transduction histidine kinase
MNIFTSTTLLVLSAVSSCVLGAIVLFRNPWKRTHRHFALLSFNLMLWSLGVLLITHSRSEEAALFWVRATFVVASFLPATFYHFIAYFPHQRFDGVRTVVITLYSIGCLLVIGAFTPWYVKGVVIENNLPPLVVYGPVFLVYPAMIVYGMVFAFANLARKVRRAAGIERRQIEHVLLAIFLTTTFASATNVLAPTLHIGSLEAYGPIFTVLMIAILAYAMVRYHLLDIWVIVSRTTVYAVVTAFVVMTFLGSVSLVHWVFSSGGRTASVLTTVLAAVVIVVVLQPLKERLQLIAERSLIKRRYDVNKLCARITQNAAQIVRLDQLLDTVARDIISTMGVELVRILLRDEKERTVLSTEYSSIPDDLRLATCEHAALIDYLTLHPEPLILKKLLHERRTDTHMVIARHLAELDAYLCVPLCTSSGVLGILTLGEKTSGDIFSSDDLTVFTTVAGPLGSAIENARLYSKLEKVNLHLASLLTSMRGGVVAVDAEERITTINASTVDMVGLARVGQGLEVLPQPIGQLLRTTLQDARGISDFETVVIGPEGENIPVVLSSACLGTPGNGNYGAMAMIHNQTQIKRLERNVQRADRLSSIGTLAAGMAHEVKNPLVSIKTFTHLLPTRFDDADFRKTFAEVVPHEVERIDTIVSRLLDFARPKPSCFESQDIRMIVEHVLALVENQTRKGRITLRLDFPDEPVMAYSDEQQLHQAFLNLVLNAIDALRESEGGTLGVRIFRDRIHLRRNGRASFRETECGRVVVWDTGCGIPPEHLEHLFTPFFTTKVAVWVCRSFMLL